MMHQHATRSNLSQKDLDANMKTWEPALEKLKELLSYLHPGIDPRQEFSIRMSAWHTYNHYWRRRERNKTKSGRSQYRFKKFSRFALWFERIRRSEWRLHRENMIKLMALFNESDPYQKLLKAEANRNYGNFKVCLNMLSTMPDSPLVEEMIRQAKRKNGLVFEAKEFKDESTELYWFVHNVVTNPTQTTPLLSIEKILINAKNGISKKEPPS